MNNNIIRTLPIFKKENNYPHRYSEEAFNKLNICLKDKEFEKKYNLLQSGINPFTKRKIKIKGKTFSKIEDNFMIHYEYQINKNSFAKTYVIFSKLKEINVDNYFRETKNLFNKIEKKNKKIRKFNKKLSNLQRKITKMNKWDEFIEFKGLNYGTDQKVKNNIHIQNNCNGIMILINETTEYICNDRPFCNYDDKEVIYNNFKCNNCNYNLKKIKYKKGGSQYISNSGFYWK